MAGDASYPRLQFRALRLAWLRRNRVFIAGAAGVTLLLIALMTFLSLAPGEPSASTWYLLGAMHAGVVAAVVMVLLHGFLAHDGEAIRQLRGAWGEENTSDELRKARRKKLIWGWVDTVGLRRGDLDHFVVTRNGGLVVLDSKFSTATDAGVAHQLAASVVRVRTRAEGLAATVLGSKSHGRRRAHGSAIPVRPAVVVWGALQRELDGITTSTVSTWFPVANCAIG